jgi:hypothetical protein
MKKNKNRIDQIVKAGLKKLDKEYNRKLKPNKYTKKADYQKEVRDTRNDCLP